MATTQQPAAPGHAVHGGVQPLRAGQGTSFVWRKLHSLLGVVPIGAFLLEHLLSNFDALKGPVAYGEQVKFLNGLPLVRVLEWTFIFLPLLYHGIYGVYIWIRGKANIVYYPWAGNWMYIAQRYTGLIAFAYIAYHVATQRFMGVSLPENPGAAFHKVQVELANPWILAVYVIAMFAVCWHFAYGVWLFAAKWGITPGEKARRRFGWVCLAGGVALCAMGLMSLWAFVGPKYQNAPENVPLTMRAPGWPGVIQKHFSGVKARDVLAATAAVRAEALTYQSCPDASSSVREDLQRTRDSHPDTGILFSRDSSQRGDEALVTDALLAARLRS